MLNFIYYRDKCQGGDLMFHRRNATHILYRPKNNYFLENYNTFVFKKIIIFIIQNLEKWRILIFKTNDMSLNNIIPRLLVLCNKYMFKVTQMFAMFL